MSDQQGQNGAEEHGGGLHDASIRVVLGLGVNGVCVVRLRAIRRGFGGKGASRGQQGVSGPAVLCKRIL